MGKSDDEDKKKYVDKKRRNSQLSDLSDTCRDTRGLSLSLGQNSYIEDTVMTTCMAPQPSWTNNFNCSSTFCEAGKYIFKIELGNYYSPFRLF